MDCQAIQYPRQGLPAYGPLRHDGHRLMRGVIDHGQVLDGAPLGRVVEHEIYRPDLIGGLRPSGCRSAAGTFLRLRRLTCNRASAYNGSTRL
jgi:hypothetical protein